MNIQRIVRVFPVVVVTRQLLDVLVQAAAQHDVQFLVTSADGEQRNPRLERPFDQHESRLVTMRIMQGPRSAGFAIVVMRLVLIE